MKKFIVMFLLFSGISFAQIGFVEYDHPVYNFLERMSSLHLIEGYDNFQIPKTRKEVTTHLKSLLNKKQNLIKIDKEIFDDLLIEFEYDIYGTTENYDSKLSEFKSENLFNEKEKFLFYSVEKEKFSLFANLNGSIESVYLKEDQTENNYNALYSIFGGSLRGSINDMFGFSVKATNGILSGDKETAKYKPNLQNNFKFNEYQAGNQSTYFDETEGYLLAEFDHIRFDIGRHRNNLGYGIIKDILTDTPPMMDHIGLNINYKFINFSWMHAKILGPETAVSDSVVGTLRTISDKYFVTHRLAFDLGKHLKIGFGENIIYANRSMDFAYLNPFNFYKTVEHAKRDRDNSQIFFDAVNNSIKGLKFYATLIIDDIDFSKLGTGWYGNKALLNLSLYSSLLNKYAPLDFSLQYLRIDPYFNSHRLSYNNFTNENIALGAPIDPNSESFILQLKYRPHYRLNFRMQIRFTAHGANKLNDDGTLKVNYGGDILEGHRNFDSEDAELLEGEKEYFRVFGFSGSYEPINNYFVRISVNYLNNHLQDTVRVKDVYSSLYLSVKI